MPPSAIRKRLRGDFNRRRQVLREIADNPEEQAKDRLKAIDIMGKFGLGVQKVLTDETVRGKLSETLAIIRSIAGPELGEQIIDALQPVWTEET